MRKGSFLLLIWRRALNIEGLWGCFWIEGFRGEEEARDEGVWVSDCGSCCL